MLQKRLPQTACNNRRHHHLHSNPILLLQQQTAPQQLPPNPAAAAVPKHLRPPPPPLPPPVVAPYLEWNAVAKNSVVGGSSIDGQQLLICQAEYDGLTQPGYSIRGSSTCNIGHWGKEIKATAYRLLDTNKAHTWSSEQGAARVKGGFAAGEDMFVCRGSIGCATYPGKAGAIFNDCYIGRDGREVAVSTGLEFMQLSG
jgi:hypothetical protein